MALRNAVMTALLDGESSGYDLAKAFDASVANYWVATPQQLYRELEKMAEEGLVEAHVVHQERRPDKRLFALTELGREALHTFTAGPTKPGAMREELMVKVAAVDGGDLAAVRADVAERRAWAEAKIARYERLRLRLLERRTEEDFFATAERVGPYLALLRGIAFERENVAWADQTLAVLDQRAARLVP
ncbi:PadR family transcriptional regulator [Actinocorallia lasiicapitis]